MQQSMDANPVQVVVLVQPGTIDAQSKYKNMKLCLAKQLIGLGIIQCVIGILCIIFQSISLGVYNSGDFDSGVDNVGHGIWAGVMFLITGPFGIAGGFKRNRWQVLAFIVLSILSAVSATVLLGITVPGAAIYALGESFCDRYYYMPNTTPYYYNPYYTTPYYYNPYYTTPYYYNYFRTTSSYSDYFNPPYGHYGCIYNIITGESRTGTAMEATIAALGLIEVIAAVWSIAICLTIAKACSFDCVGSCSSFVKNQLLTINQSSPDQQQLVTNNQQQAPFNQQPQMQPPSYQLLQMQPPTYQPLQMQPLSNQQPQVQPPSNQQPQMQPPSNQQPQMQPLSNQQPQMQQSPNQQPQIQQPPNQQSQMFTPDQAMATVPTWQHTIINLDQGQHVIQFNLHQPNPSPHRQQADANATVFSGTADQGCNTGMTVGLGINLACPE